MEWGRRDAARTRPVVPTRPVLAGGRGIGTSGKPVMDARTSRTDECGAGDTDDTSKPESDEKDRGLPGRMALPPGMAGRIAPMRGFGTPRREGQGGPPARPPCAGGRMAAW